MAVSGYFVLPQVGNGTFDDKFRPKYMDDPRVLKYYAGEGIERAGNTWIPTRVYVADDDAAALDTLESQSDAYRIYPGDVETALNGLGVFPQALTAREWALLFSKFLMND